MPPAESLVLGVDGGNTKTIALVGKTDGRITGYGRAGGSDIYQAKPEPAMVEVRKAITEAIPGREKTSQPMTAALSMAGADWPEDFDLIAHKARRMKLGDRMQVVNDGIGALRASSAEGIGVVIVCGTGGAVGAKAPSGKMWHSSFWQEVQGSRHLAEKTLSALYKAELDIGPRTALTERVLQVLGFDSVDDLLHAATSRDASVRNSWNLHAVTRVLMDEAAGGDQVAAAIVSEHGRGLAQYALAAARIVGLDEETKFCIFLAGGVFRHPSCLLRTAIAEAIHGAWPNVEIKNSRFEPAVGAYLLALELAGCTIDEALLQRVESSLPPVSFFAT